jgi:type II secretory pathway pseudopilin PulG
MDRGLKVLLIASGVIVVTGAVAVASAWVWPKYRDHARRSQVANIMLAASTLRQEVTERSQQAKTLTGVGKGMSFKPSSPVTGATVSDDGVIVVNGTVDGHAVTVALKPSLAGGEVRWNCRHLKSVEGWFAPEGGYFPRSCPKAASLDSF